MTYFVFYSYGSCEYGDHNSNLEEFDTEADAVARADEVMRENASSEPTVSIIEGRELAYRTPDKRASEVEG